jgi:hypothetical protein
LGLVVAGKSALAPVQQISNTTVTEKTRVTRKGWWRRDCLKVFEALGDATPLKAE